MYRPGHDQPLQSMWAYAKVSTLLRLRQRPRVFVSYRRRDGGHAAARLADKLKDDFDLFWDLKKIKAGNDFPRAIQQAVEGSHIMLALIGPQWATELDESRRRRLDDPADWVAHEIAVGLRRNVVIPVLIDGARMPERSQLPAHIAKLSDLHAMTVRQESFDDDVERLRRTIWEAVVPPSPLWRKVAVSAALLLAAVVGIAIATGLTGPTGSGPPSVSRSSTDSGAPRLGQSMTFEYQEVTVYDVRFDTTHGYLVHAKVCVRKLADTSPTTKLSWNAWWIEDDTGDKHHPTLDDDNGRPPLMYARTGRYRVGECAQGFIPFNQVPGTRQLTAVLYRGREHSASWTL